MYVTLECNKKSVCSSALHYSFDLDGSWLANISYREERTPWRFHIVGVKRVTMSLIDTENIGHSGAVFKPNQNWAYASRSNTVKISSNGSFSCFTTEY